MELGSVSDEAANEVGKLDGIYQFNVRGSTLGAENLAPDLER